MCVRYVPPHFLCCPGRTESSRSIKVGRDGHSLPQGRAGLSPEAVKAIAGRSPGTGGRPLRRRREMRSVYGRQRLRGTAALQASSDRRCRHRKLTRKHLEAPWNGGKGGGPWERKAHEPAGERGIGPYRHNKTKWSSFHPKTAAFQGESGTAGRPRAKAPDFAKPTSRLAFWRHLPQDEGRHSVATAAWAILWTPSAFGGRKIQMASLC